MEGSYEFSVNKSGKFDFISYITEIIVIFLTLLVIKRYKTNSYIKNYPIFVVQKFAKAQKYTICAAGAIKRAVSR